MQLLRRVPDLRAHAELAAVREARGGVDVHAGGIDPQLEGTGRRHALGDDRLRVAAAVRVDVIDRLLHRVDNLHGQHERQELGVPILLGRVDELPRQPLARERVRAPIDAELHALRPEHP